MDFKEKDSVRILVGVYAGKEGKVDTIAEGAEKLIGVHIPGERIPLIWFEPEEVEKLR